MIDEAILQELTAIRQLLQEVIGRDQITTSRKIEIRELAGKSPEYFRELSRKDTAMKRGKHGKSQRHD